MIALAGSATPVIVTVPLPGKLSLAPIYPQGSFIILDFQDASHTRRQSWLSGRRRSSP